MLVASVSFVAEAGDGDLIVETINAKRRAGGICPEATYSGGETLAAQSFPASNRLLKRNSDLDRAAQNYARDRANKQVTIQQEYKYIPAQGYLPWRAASGSGKTRGDELQVANNFANGRFTCNNIMSPQYSDIGVGKHTDADGWVTTIYIVAERFEPQRAAEYGRQLFDEINRIRRQGVTCFETQYPRKAAYQWSATLADAAQAHSDDMATWPYKGGDVHTGSDGSQPSDRVKRAKGESCIYGGENVSSNSRSIERPARAWTDQLGAGESNAMKSGHCKNVMSDAIHAGVGISLQRPLAQTSYGRHPWVTLVVGTCRDVSSPTPDLSSQPDLLISKSHTGAPCVPGGNCSFLFKVSNVGRAPYGPAIEIADNLPTAWNFVALGSGSPGWSCSQTASQRQLICSNPVRGLSPDQTLELAVTLVLPPDEARASATNCAQFVFIEGTDDRAGDRNDKDCVTVNIQTVANTVPTPSTPTTAMASFDPNWYYQISNIALGNFSLDVNRNDRAKWYDRGPKEAIVLRPSGGYTGQHWLLQPAPGKAGHVTMSTQFRGENVKFTLSRAAPVLWLRHQYDPQNPSGFPKSLQYWRYVAVSGKPDTYYIINGLHRVLLSSSPSKQLAIVQDTSRNRQDSHAQWKIRQVLRK